MLLGAHDDTGIELLKQAAYRRNVSLGCSHLERERGRGPLSTKGLTAQLGSDAKADDGFVGLCPSTRTTCPSNAMKRNCRYIFYFISLLPQIMVRLYRGAICHGPRGASTLERT